MALKKEELEAAKAVVPVLFWCHDRAKIKPFPVKHVRHRAGPCEWGKGACHKEIDDQHNSL